MQPKKATKALSTIRAELNDTLDVHTIVVWIVSGMKELLHLPNQLLPVTIHQSVCTYLHILSDKVVFNVYVTFSLDVTCHMSEVQ